MDLVYGHVYLLAGMERSMWDRPHPSFGAPATLAARYLGCLIGVRRWHGFEVWIEDREEGVLFMHDDDLKKLTVTEL